MSLENDPFAVRPALAWTALLGWMAVSACGAPLGGEDAAAPPAADGGQPAEDAGASPDAGTSGPLAVRLSGAVEKGPFVLGSRVDVSPVDALGNPTGQVFGTHTTNDLGQFRVDFSHTGLVSLAGSGFYYDEISGRLSSAPIVLRAFHEISAGGPQEAYINLVTHLTYDRVRWLLGEGLAFAQAVAQAEGELAVGLGLLPPASAAAKGVQMNILGGDTDPNAYLFAVSVVVGQAAAIRAEGRGSVDAVLQELVNNLSLDLSDDGALQQNLRRDLLAAQQAVDPERVMALLAARLEDLGTSAAVPDLNRFIDSDLDGIPNALDNCRLIANPDQAPVTDDFCLVRERAQRVFEDLHGQRALRFVVGGDWDGDGKRDLALVHQDRSVTMLLGDGLGGLQMAGSMLVGPAPTGHDRNFPLAALVGDLDGDGCDDLGLVLSSGQPNDPLPMHLVHGTPTGLRDVEPMGSFGPQTQAVVMADFDGDGKQDLAFAQRTAGMLHAIHVRLGDGAGGFAPEQSFGADLWVSSLFAVDLNGDGRPDLVAGNDAGIHVLLGDGAGGFGAPTTLFPRRLQSLGWGDFDGDGRMDLVVADVMGGLTVLLGDGLGGVASQVVHRDAAGWYVYHLAAGDVTGDGKVDVAAAGQPGLLLMASAGNDFGSTLSRDDREQGLVLAIEDLDGDGRGEVIAAYHDGLVVWYHVNP